MRTVRQNASLGNTNVATVRQKCDAQRLGKPHVATVRQKCVAKRIPFSRNSLSVNQKWQPFVRNATHNASANQTWRPFVRNASQNAYRSAETRYRQTKSCNRSSEMRPKRRTVEQKWVSCPPRSLGRGSSSGLLGLSTQVLSGPDMFSMSLQSRF